MCYAKNPTALFSDVDLLGHWYAVLYRIIEVLIMLIVHLLLSCVLKPSIEDNKQAKQNVKQNVKTLNLFHEIEGDQPTFFNESHG